MLVAVVSAGCRSARPAPASGYRRVTVFPIEGLWESEWGSRIRFDRPARGIYVGRLAAPTERELKRGFREGEIIFTMRFVKPYLYEGTVLTKTQPEQRDRAYPVRITVGRDLYSMQVNGSGKQWSSPTTWQRVGRPSGRPRE